MTVPLTGPLTFRALAGMARCPFCRADVYLASCDRLAAPPIEADDTAVFKHVRALDWSVEHTGPHRHIHMWLTGGPIELRPVVHLRIVPADDRVPTVPCRPPVTDRG